MRTTAILMIVIALVAFALFFRLYKGKLDILSISSSKKEDFKCVLKQDKEEETFIDETMRVFVNRAVPLVKGGSVKLQPKHIPLVMDEVKNLLSLFVPEFCNLQVSQPSAEPVMEKGIPVYKVIIEEELIQNFQNGPTS